jgi:LysM repeat protein
LRKVFGVLGIVFGTCFFWLVMSGVGYADTYAVQPGDSFYAIAQDYAISADQLMAANGDISSTLYPGQVLTIPGENTAAPAAAGNNEYTVAAGDTLYQIAQSFGTTMDALVALNNLSPDSQGNVDIYPGQVLQVPCGQSETETGSGSVAWTRQYTARPGDTMAQLAQQYGTSVAAIVAGNNLTDGTLYPGQQLLLPGTSPGPQATRAGITSGDSYLLAQLINAEAGGEPFEGQVAVGAVVLNRLFNPSFPKTIKDIVFQNDDGTYQFEPVQNGAINEQPSASAILAARAALSGDDPTGGALYFFNPQKCAGGFFENLLTYLKQIGSQVFYK